MFSKSVIRVFTTRLLLYRDNIRLSNQRCLSNRSFLHNTGTAPLSYATLGEKLAETVHRYPDRVAVKSLHEDVTLTYEQLLTRADSLGCAFRAQGLKAGDRVGIWLHNSASWSVVVLAAARAGLISVLINHSYEKPELSYCIKKAGLKSLVIDDKLLDRDHYKIISELVPELQNSKPGFIKSELFPSLTSIVINGKEKLPGAFTIDSLVTDYWKNKDEISKYESEVGPDDGSLIHFTSGTTGKPKAVVDSHFGVVNNIHFTGMRNLYGERHHSICVQAPLFHALGSVITMLSGLSHGATLVLPSPIYSVTANVHALYAEKCTATNGTPTMYVDLLNKVSSKGLEAPSLKTALAAGAPCSPQLIKDIKKYLNVETMKCLYGLTETTACVFQSNYDDSVEQVAETVGYIQDHLQLKVVDNEGKTVPFGSPGELLVRGYCNMIGYLDDPDKTRETLSESGWVKTGDKFTISEDGYGRIVGRLKDIIIRGGENIAPKEIEDLLNIHPDIIESQVVGVSDERLGEELCAVLRLREGATITLADISQYLSGKVAKFKIPKIMKTADTFPKTTSGKIQKYKVKELIESGKL